MTASGRPLLTAAIAAGVLSFGEAHGPGWFYAEMVNRYLDRAKAENLPLQEAARLLVEERRARGKKIYGLNQPQHVDGDPRALHLLRRAKDLGVAGRHIEFQEHIIAEYHRQTGRRLHANVLGAGGAVLLDLGFNSLASWAIGVLCRAFSCAAHAVEEMQTQPAWRASRRGAMVDILDLSLQGPKHYHGPRLRRVPTQEERTRAEREGRVLEDCLPPASKPGDK
jgi:citrate synthase